MTKNKIIAMLLATVLVLSLVAVSVPASATDAYAVHLTDANGSDVVIAQPGDTVKLALSLENNPGIIGVGVELSYPKELSLTAKPTLTMKDADYFNGCSQYVTANPFLVWLNMATGTKDNKLVKYNGQIAEISFKVAANAQPGDYTITLAAPADKNTTASVDSNGVIHPQTNTPIQNIKLTGCTIRIENKLEGWQYEGGKWYFYENGEKLTNCWKADSIGWVYLGKDGAMLTNAWCTDSKGWCYVGADGYALTNCWAKDSIGWIWLDANGSMTKNTWIKDGGKWYFLDEKGYMASNQWRKDSKGWCWLTASGAMAVNQWVADSKGWCYIGADGYCWTNCWAKDSIGWIWLDSEGSMTKNAWVNDGGSWYYLDGNGYMVTNRSLQLSGKTYNFNASGVCTNP